MNSENMRISIFNVLGSLQAELINSTMESGRHSIVWDASNKSSGIYFIELSAENFRSTQKLILLK